MRAKPKTWESSRAGSSAGAAMPSVSQAFRPSRRSCRRYGAGSTARTRLRRSITSRSGGLAHGGKSSWTRTAPSPCGSCCCTAGRLGCLQTNGMRSWRRSMGGRSMRTRGSCYCSSRRFVPNQHHSIAMRVMILNEQLPVHEHWPSEDSNHRICGRAVVSPHAGLS